MSFYNYPEHAFVSGMFRHTEDRGCPTDLESCLRGGGYRRHRWGFQGWRGLVARCRINSDLHAGKGTQANELLWRVEVGKLRLLTTRLIARLGRTQWLLQFALPHLWGRMRRKTTPSASRIESECEPILESSQPIFGFSNLWHP